MNIDASTTAFVLCGGLGTRLQEALPPSCPKALARVAGEQRPFLDFLLDQIADSGIADRIVLCTGHLGDAIRQRYGNRYRGIKIEYSHEHEPKGTGGAIQQAVPLASTEDLLILNGDSYCDVDLRTFLRWSRNRATQASIVAVEVDAAGRFGQLNLGSANRVLRFCEKGGSTGRGWIHSGILFVTRATADSWDHAGSWSLERDFLARCPDLLAWPQHKPFLDIGTPATLAAAQSFFSSTPQPSHRGGLLILDRDGTVIEERHYLQDPAEVTLLPGVVEGLREAQASGYRIAIVTNQSGVGRGYFNEQRLEQVHERVLQLLADEGIEIAGIWHCPHHPDDGCTCRKPATGLLLAASDDLGYAPSECVVVGDKACDIELGKNGGVRASVLVRTGYGAATEQARACEPDAVVDGLAQLRPLLR